MTTPPPAPSRFADTVGGLLWGGIFGLGGIGFWMPVRVLLPDHGLFVLWETLVAVPCLIPAALLCRVQIRRTHGEDTAGIALGFTLPWVLPGKSNPAFGRVDVLEHLLISGLAAAGAVGLVGLAWPVLQRRRAARRARRAWVTEDVQDDVPAAPSRGGHAVYGGFVGGRQAEAEQAARDRSAPLGRS